MAASISPLHPVRMPGQGVSCGYLLDCVALTEISTSHTSFPTTERKGLGMDKIGRQQFGNTEWDVIWDFIDDVPEGAVIEFKGLANRMMYHDRVDIEQQKIYNIKARELGGLIAKAVSDAECDLFPLEFLAHVKYPDLKAKTVGERTFLFPTETRSLKPAVNPGSKKLQYLKTSQERMREELLPKN